MVILGGVKKKRIYERLCFILLIVVVWFFLTEKRFTFYIIFEFRLIPTLIMIFFYGYQPEKLQARIYLLMYTVVTSLPFLLLICRNKPYLHFIEHQGFYWYVLALTMGFIVKTPLYLVHVWLPKAHVEAPLAGSIVLAGVLLKLGRYGVMLICPGVARRVLIMYVFLTLLGSIYCSFICLLSYDIKSLIAYSSVVHIGVVTLGVVRGVEIGYKSAMIIIIGHGVCSPFLFGWAYRVYQSRHRRIITINKGQLSIPILVFVRFMLLAINMGVPPFLNLWREILMFIVRRRIWKMSLIWLLVAAFINIVYNMFIWVRVRQRKESPYRKFDGMWWPFLRSIIASLVLVLVI